jgi:molybdate transport system permease protein
VSASEVLSITLLTLRVGLVACALVLVPGVAVGWLLARGRFRGRGVLQVAVSLPMVLPPVAVGLVLLLALSRRSPLGAAIERLLGSSLLLTWPAAALAAALMAFPMLVLGAQQGFLAVPRRLEHVGASLGARPARVFATVTLPLAARGILGGLAFAFARAIGEFGATVIVAGNVPGRTETLALAIYARIQEFRDADALLLCAVSVLLAVGLTAVAELCLRRRAAA